MQSDPLADFLSSLRNASLAGKATILVPSSRLKFDVAKVLQREGYLSDVEVLTENKAKPVLKIGLKGTGRAGAIQQIARVSRPGRRVYAGSAEIPRVLGGLGVAVVSTSRGVMAGHQARKQKLGGEVLLTIS
jgi:small subunit ribosomal protein S8